MAARHSVAHLSRRAAGALANSSVSASRATRDVSAQIRTFATPVPPVTQNSVGSKGPTAMVFLNMGGPSTTDEVGDFLTRLFVSTLNYTLIGAHGVANEETARR